ncbi:MAG: 50S ribosomal protein L21 [Desulfofustis sp. PB-SRB1]|jgi:large subunit ribosomal protein L21|nr:50S ribosomal protein L21 [Desulfofustis sp. PB-SRB1]MBM1001458.1 50S ribosomal protein L21 [Desulfofustis sp. PB-SRB1]HBH28984.1 50S ribosomal protein L21 [Desulfofustis sp.]HBH31423.1 50S ribosomal protein L21 [Desulfofustis sp.]
MYAIVKTGGKQYQVAVGDRLRVEKLSGNVGDPVELDQVLLLADEETVFVGRPVLDTAKVTATIAEQGKRKKILVFKKKRRKGYRRMQGHRQHFTTLLINDISA